MASRTDPTPAATDPGPLPAATDDPEATLRTTPAAPADDGQAQVDVDPERLLAVEMADDVQATVRHLLLLPWVVRRLRRGQPVTRVELVLYFASPTEAVTSHVELQRG